jgi:hypothetical protein
MKKVILIAAIILATGLNGLFAQHLVINPIPNYNFPLTATNTGFQEKKTHILPSREKREMDVVITSSSSSPMLVFAKVWVVKDNGSVTLGPFTIFPDEPLNVQIDNGVWGVIIQSDWDLLASVWIE